MSKIAILLFAFLKNILEADIHSHFIIEIFFAFRNMIHSNRLENLFQSNLR